ncbi:MFS transporter [Nocardia australiensis]|uniref:MFS transporter n=1 Tax=Nocardia australiensis TaxID=2887191 RepID=UPI001D14E55C|nr:MFS transporter [Nocardia australiensis]
MPVAATPEVGAGGPEGKAAVWKVAWASAIGSTIEWYDFFLYGTAAATVFDKQFFPSLNPTLGTIAAFSTLTVGFLARPLGGVVFGHFGDKIGRRNTLIVSLLLMGVATTLIGALPTYATAGIWAPLLLVMLRLVQGIGLGGEWGGAVVLTLEHAPNARRGFFGSFPQLGTPAGLILANGAFLGTNALMSNATFASWGWRIPFLASVVLVALGLYLRLHIQESPVFADLVKHKRPQRQPAIEIVTHHWKPVLHATLVIVGNSTAAYIFMVYVLSYGVQHQHLGKSFMLAAVIAGSVVWLVSVPFWAVVGDRVGLRPVFAYGSAIRLVWCLVFFPIVDTGNKPLIFGFMISMGLVLSMTNAPIGTLTAGFFPASVRYSGTSIAYQIGSLLGGGITPLVAASLYAATDTSWSVTGYVVAVSVISLLASIAIKTDVPTSRVPAPEATAPIAG